MNDSAKSNLTVILSEINNNSPNAAEKLLPLIYDELKRLAAKKMAGEQGHQTLQATALVHEAYIKLMSSENQPDWQGRAHFFRAAAEAMRRILIDRYRRKLAIKNGGEINRENIPLDQISIPDSGHDLLSLNEAIEGLAAAHPRNAELVKLRYFAGLTNTEAADLLNISKATAERDWAFARAWLLRELRSE